MPQPTIYSKILEWIEGRGSRNPSKIIQKFNQKSIKKMPKSTLIFQVFSSKNLPKITPKSIPKSIQKSLNKST